MSKKTAIILINWNSFYHTNNCIQSILGSKASDYDIIVVDNGSIDGSGQTLKATYLNILLIESPENLGFSGGNNLALKYSLEQGYTYSFLLNNDTFVDTDFLTPLVNYLDSNATIGAAQPKIFFHTKRNILWNGGSIYNKIFGITYSNRYLRTEGALQKKIHTVDWITGCAFFIRNAALVQSGLLSENMFMYFEDVDLSMRIQALGYKLIFLPSSIIYHIAGASNESAEKNEEGYSNPDKYYINFRNRIWFLKKYTPFYCMPTVLLYNLLYFTAFLFYFLIRRRFKKFNAVLRAIKDGIAGKIQ